jgi:transposase-like protein
VNRFDSSDEASANSTSPSPANSPSACPACRSLSITTTEKSPDVNSYWRCKSCGEIWNAARRDKLLGRKTTPWR